MDRLRLTLGTITCRVERRNTSRSFQLEAGEFRATVLGTKFAVQVEAGGGVAFGVLEGEVEVAALSGTWPPRLIPADFEIHVRPEAAGAVQPLSRALAALLRPSSQPPPGTTPARLARLESPRPADVSPETGTTPEARPAPPPTTTTIAHEGLEALVERIYRDTHWIFDDARAAMERGEFEAVASRLENYIQDPESPGRDEAVFLRAACLEKLGRLREAREHYRRYLWDWPQGRWVRDAQQGLVRASRP
jgi:TolA-binding protein